METVCALSFGAVSDGSVLPLPLPVKPDSNREKMARFVMKEARWKAAFPGNAYTSAHIGGQVLLSEDQTYSFGTAFTSSHWSFQFLTDFSVNYDFDIHSRIRIDRQCFQFLTGFNVIFDLLRPHAKRQSKTRFQFLTDFNVIFDADFIP